MSIFRKLLLLLCLISFTAFAGDKPTDNADNHAEYNSDDDSVLIIEEDIVFSDDAADDSADDGDSDDSSNESYDDSDDTSSDYN